MRRSLLSWFRILSLCLVWALLFPDCVREKKELGQAPDFTLKTFRGQEITLSKLRGKVVLLDFWATWCGPCKESIPHLVQTYKTYQPQGLEVIGMNVDKGDVNAVRRFVQSMDIPYPVVTTPEDVVRNYGVVGLPTTVLVDKQGRIRDKIPGFTVKMGQAMATKVSQLVSENP
jgi:cytochrome c biogenesis protein CcmG/thiol:disulfide interchange protein DsbE